jgi:hypothetical protein
MTITVSFTADQFQSVTSESASFRKIIGADTKEKLEKAFQSALTPTGAASLSILQKMSIVRSLAPHNKIAAIKSFRQLFTSEEKELIFKRHTNFFNENRDSDSYASSGIEGLWTAKFFVENYLHNF